MTHSGEARPAPGSSALRAQAILDRDGSPEVFDFDAVSVSADDPETLVVALADVQGRTLTLILPRKGLKKLLSWRMLL